MPKHRFPSQLVAQRLSNLIIVGQGSPMFPFFKVILIVLAQLVSIIPSPQLVLPSGVTHNCEIPEKDHPVITDGTETLGNHMCRGPNMFVFFSWGMVINPLLGFNIYIRSKDS